MSEAVLSSRSRLAQLVFDLRLVAVGLTVIDLSMRRESPAPASVWFALGVALLTSYLALRHAEAADTLVQRRPVLLALDVALGQVLLGITGTGSPFVYYTVGSVLLAGLLRGPRAAWAAAAALLAVYTLLLSTRTGFEVGASDFQGFAGVPALYPLSAAGSVAVRRLFERQQADADRIGRLSMEEAAAAERTLLAREIHDSVAGDLSGIALSAGALAELIPRDPARAAERADQLASAAARTAAGARDVIRMLRDTPPDLPLDRALEILLTEWSAQTGTRAVLARADQLALPVEARAEALAVCKEALANVFRHAGPCSVTVEVIRDDPARAQMVIADDGVGFPAEVDMGTLAQGGHYGVVGMKERAARVGGTVQVRSAPGAGTRVVLTLPAADPAT